MHQKPIDMTTRARETELVGGWVDPAPTERQGFVQLDYSLYQNTTTK